MTDTEKEVIIECKKRQFRNIYPQDVADELCRRLDEAKKGADALEQLLNGSDNLNIESSPFFS